MIEQQPELVGTSVVALMTGGHQDRTRCYALLGPDWRTDLCQAESVEYVSGRIVGGWVYTHLCRPHADELAAAGALDERRPDSAEAAYGEGRIDG
jgi:hypothetical protein